jgi:DNA-binding transcriptional ArsR family regulator
MKSSRDKKNRAAEMSDLARSAQEASDFLKALANENRLLMLCLLAEGEKSVTELEDMLKLRQSSVSQQLARLRADDLVMTRREGKAIYYSLSSDPARMVMDVLHKLFCQKDAKKAGTRRTRTSVAAE